MSNLVTRACDLPGLRGETEDSEIAGSGNEIGSGFAIRIIELVDIECVLGDVSFALINPPFWMLRTLFL